MPDTHVILAEDDNEIRTLISECLAEQGFNVKEAADGLTALQYIENANAPILLLTDIRMPRMSGQELVERALAIQPELKVVMMTGYVEELLTGKALQAREIKTFFKPFKLPELCEYVVSMLRRP